MLSLISMPTHFGGVRPGAAVYGTAATGPQRSAEVAMFGLVTSTAPDGTPVVIGIHNESQYGPNTCRLEVLAADPSAGTTATSWSPSCPGPRSRQTTLFFPAACLSTSRRCSRCSKRWTGSAPGPVVAGTEGVTA